MKDKLVIFNILAGILISVVIAGTSQEQFISKYLGYIHRSRIGGDVTNLIEDIKTTNSIYRADNINKIIPKVNGDTITTAQVGIIENKRYRIKFFESVCNNVTTYTRDIYVKEDMKWVPINNKKERCDEKWAVFQGDNGSHLDYYSSMRTHWVSFTKFKQIDEQTVSLIANNSGLYEFEVRWSLDSDNPEITFELEVDKKGNFVVGYQSFTGENIDDISEVLNGPLQHAKMVRGVESYGERTLSAPISMYEKQINDKDYSLGVYVPTSQIAFEHTQQHEEDKQHYGMSLTNNNGQVQPILYAPQYGEYSSMKAGQNYSFTLGLYAKQNSLTKAYEEIIREEYGYKAYRQNVFNTSLTQTMFNLIKLLKADSGIDDSKYFQPSPSGWWSRAKGFADIENEQSVRTTSTSALLSAYYLTQDEELYRERALPTIEYHLSRNYYGWTPKEGVDIYGEKGYNKMASTPFDVSALSPLYNMTGQLNAGIYKLALEHAESPTDFWLKRTPINTPLATYRLTEDKKYLKDAIRKADKYIKNELEEPYTENVDPHDFQYYYSKAWTELLEMYEETGFQRYLDAAHKEARRYITQVFVRPVPSGTLTVPDRPFVSYVHDRWEPSAIYDYPRTAKDVKSEEVEKWVVSRNGLSFEQLSTYKSPNGGFRLNPAEASFLLRLAYYTDDELLRDVAHNLVVGRYTNYPGYYNRQYSTTHMKPDFPYRGPSGASMIYHHHAPAQLGMTIDYLLTEQITRSNENIYFPSEFEANYVWFKYRLYGHKPGSFYGNEDVWLWMPPDIISTDNYLANWITAESGDTFYISLTNSSDKHQQVSIDLNEELIGFDPEDKYPITIIKDNGVAQKDTTKLGKLRTDVSPMGITAIIVEEVNVDAPSRRTKDIKDTKGDSYSFGTNTEFGKVKGTLLMHPDTTSYNAFIQTNSMEGPITLHYSTDSGENFISERDSIYPFEWSVKVRDISKKFTYYLESVDKRTKRKTLFFPYSLN